MNTNEKVLQVSKNNLKKIALWMLGNDNNYVLQVSNENLYLNSKGELIARGKNTGTLRSLKTARKFDIGIRKNNLQTYYFVINEFMNGRIKKVEA